MRRTTPSTPLSFMMLVAAVTAVQARVNAQTPPGTAFTYQGQVKRAGLPLNGTADFEFLLWDADVNGQQVGSTQIVSNVTVADGLFAVQLDFGASAFAGQARWLEIAVRTPAGSGGYLILAPRQAVTPTPYALHSAAPWVTGANGVLSYAEGSIGIGTDSPAHNLEVVGESDATVGVFGTSTDNAYIAFGRDRGITGYTVGECHDQSFRVVAHGIDSLQGIILDIDGNVGIGTPAPASTLDVAGTTTTHVLAITGGSDFAEPFSVVKAADSDQAIVPGMVVVIDPDHPGALKLATEAYDCKVAGVVSGANGLQPGIVMKSEGQPHADGDHPVALSGRVWCWCDAENAAIVPGDRLTTSSTPGHAMKITDSEQAIGAVIGKAMSPLSRGRGLVLVLVQPH